MIHYHGAPIGGSNAGAAAFLLGKHALVSHAHPRQIGIVAECCQSFILDNGAFTQWKRGKPVDTGSYYRWVRTWWNHPGFDWALIPDVIEGSEKDNDDLIREWEAETQDHSYKGVPVYHYHESLERLERLVYEWPTVALGSSSKWSHPGSGAWWARTAEIMVYACGMDGVPLCKLHGLRMLNPKIFEYLPLSSADSANAAINQGSTKRFGQYLPPSSSLRATVIAARIEALNSSERWEGPPT